jgi:hypothetical protein
MTVRKAIKPSIKHRIFKFYNYTCPACGFYDEYGFHLTVDHIVPIAKGGTNDIENLQCLCQTCNMIKGKKHLKPLRVRKKPDLSVSTESYMAWVSQNRMDFYSRFSDKSAGWFKQRDDTLKLLDKTVLTQSQRDRLNNAIRTTFNLRKNAKNVSDYFSVYRMLVIEATPANQRCTFAY